MSPDQIFLQKLFDAAIAAADPFKALEGTMPRPPKGRTIVVGAGKGVAQLAAAFEAHWQGPLEGVVVTRYGYGAPCRQIKVLEAAHPVPDSAGLQAAKALEAAIQDLTPDDLVVALVTGGGSSLLPAPPDGFSLEDEQVLNTELLASGAPISTMNAIRKQFSRMKGGRLAEMAYPAKVVNLIVSDVPGDAPHEVASGPCVPDPSGAKEATAAINAYGIVLPAKMLDFIASEKAPRPGDKVFSSLEVHVIASARQSLEAAAKVCADAGISAVILSDRIEGEAREIAKMHGAMAIEVADRARPFGPPVVMLSGGETTVTLKGNGKGGRNTEFLLSLAITCNGMDKITALAADTDGIDGSEDNAGAFIDGSTCDRLRSLGADPAALLSNNDAWSAFDMLGDLFSPGPTGTNVNDFRAILVR